MIRMLSIAPISMAKIVLSGVRHRGLRRAYQATGRNPLLTSADFQAAIADTDLRRRDFMFMRDPRVAAASALSL